MERWDCGYRRETCWAVIDIFVARFVSCAVTLPLTFQLLSLKDPVWGFIFGSS